MASVKTSLTPTRRTLLAGAAAAPALMLPAVALAAPQTDPHAAWLAEARRLWRIDSGRGEDVAGDRAGALEDLVIATPARPRSTACAPRRACFWTTSRPTLATTIPPRGARVRSRPGSSGCSGRCAMAEAGNVVRVDFARGRPLRRRRGSVSVECELAATRQVRDALVQLGVMVMSQTAEMIRIESELAALDGEVAP